MSEIYTPSDRRWRCVCTGGPRHCLFVYVMRESLLEHGPHDPWHNASATAGGRAQQRVNWSFRNHSDAPVSHPARITTAKLMHGTSAVPEHSEEHRIILFTLGLTQGGLKSTPAHVPRFLFAGAMWAFGTSQRRLASSRHGWASLHILRGGSSCKHCRASTAWHQCHRQHSAQEPDALWWEFVDIYWRVSCMYTSS